MYTYKHTHCYFQHKMSEGTPLASAPGYGTVPPVNEQPLPQEPPPKYELPKGQDMPGEYAAQHNAQYPPQGMLLCVIQQNIVCLHTTWSPVVSTTNIPVQ